MKNESNIDITKNVYLAGNPQLEAAMKKFNDDQEAGGGDIAPVFDLIVEQMKNDVEVISPVIFPGGLPIPDENALAEDGTAEEETTMWFQKLGESEDDLWMVAFTSEGESAKGQKSSSIPILLKELFECVLNEEPCQGIVINPFGDSISITKQGVAALLAALEPPTQDELDLDAGSAAYSEGDYETAFALYKKSAEAGNVTALSNLGYCYYYGRSIPVDKAKAHECWEKAAILGDVCAIYKVGDMYRNGDLPKDEVFAKEMYMKAFHDSLGFMDLNCYPDAFLRVLKYCPEMFGALTLNDIAQKCREGFQARVDGGDKFAVKLLEQAEELCVVYQVIVD